MKYLYQLQYQHSFWLVEDYISFQWSVSKCRAGEMPPGIFCFSGLV